MTSAIVFVFKVYMSRLIDGGAAILKVRHKGHDRMKMTLYSFSGEIHLPQWSVIARGKKKLWPIRRSGESLSSIYS
jgi:hypothetical protein